MRKSLDRTSLNPCPAWGRTARGAVCGAALALLLAACGGGGGDGSEAGEGGGAEDERLDAALLTTTPTSPTALALKMGKPARLLVGLGSSAAMGETQGDTLAAIQAQALKPDIYEAYLAFMDWPSWNSPAGAYVNVHAAKADKVGAVPMFTMYQMASNGDGNLAGLMDRTFMKRYWDNVRLMYQRLAIYNKPAFVVVEPDFWGYAQQQSGGDPTRLTARVILNPDCTTLANNVRGVARCYIAMARKYAPKVAVGFMPSQWGGASATDVANFMVAIGAKGGDFIAMETLDRDAGCFEARGTGCTRSGTFYWDDAAYAAHLSTARTYYEIIRRPLVWWQTPMGVPSATPGGSTNAYRDNRMQYFLTGRGPADLVSVGGLGVVFSQGRTNQTGLLSDGGQYKRLSSAYLAAPVTLKK